MLNKYLEVNPEVAEALAAGKPVVALESTIISHGMPYPQNVNMAREVERIIREMPYIDETDKLNSTMDIDPDCYEDMIDKHFRTRYRNCDYNINHFFSGRIRELRFYETCY